MPLCDRSKNKLQIDKTKKKTQKKKAIEVLRQKEKPFPYNNMILF